MHAYRQRGSVPHEYEIPVSQVVVGTWHFTSHAFSRFHYGMCWITTGGFALLMPYYPNHLAYAVVASALLAPVCTRSPLRIPIRILMGIGNVAVLLSIRIAVVMLYRWVGWYG